MAKKIVILGGAFAGLNIAHRLLKHTRPSLKDGLEVILVTKVNPLTPDFASAPTRPRNPC